MRGVRARAWLASWQSIYNGLGILRGYAAEIQPQWRLVLRGDMRALGRAAILVSPRLDEAVARRLQALYLSDDAFIRRLYFELGGMARIVNAEEVGEVQKP